MPDDWNLKGKKVNSTLLETKKQPCSDEHILSSPERWINKKAYPTEAIETLRNKLIEDIIDFYIKEEPKTFSSYQEYFKYRGQRIIDEIINKRFGVDE